MAAARVCTQVHVQTRTHTALRTRIMAISAHNCMHAVFNMSLPVRGCVGECVRGCVGACVGAWVRAWARRCVGACVLKCVRA